MMRGTKVRYAEPSGLYRSIRQQCLKFGMTPMRAAISATLALEEMMANASPMESLLYLAAIGTVAIPDMERAEPANDQEAEERRDMLSAYNIRKPEDFRKKCEELRNSPIYQDLQKR